MARWSPLTKRQTRPDCATSFLEQTTPSVYATGKSGLESPCKNGLGLGFWKGCQEKGSSKLFRYVSPRSDSAPCAVVEDPASESLKDFEWFQSVFNAVRIG